MQAAAAAGLVLRPRVARCFDEVHDVAAFDLVLVMDHFDHTEVGVRLSPCLPGNMAPDSAGHKSLASHTSILAMVSCT
jgi:hypothetical protein